MGSIFKDSSGNVSVQFNEGHLSEPEIDIIKAAICRYSQDIPTAQMIHLFELMNKIISYGGFDKEIVAMLCALEKASIECEYAFYFFRKNHDSADPKVEVRRAKCENLKHAQHLFPKHVYRNLAKIDLFCLDTGFKPSMINFNVHQQKKHELRSHELG